jgi:fucose permease
MEDAIEVIEKDGSYFWIVRKNHTSLMSVVIMMEIVSGSLLHILQGHCSSFLSFYKLSFDDASYSI